MPTNSGDAQRSSDPWEAREAAAAAREAAAIGGRAGDEHLDPAQRPLIEAGEGVADGFELAEEELIEAAEHGDSRANPLADAFTPEADRGLGSANKVKQTTKIPPRSLAATGDRSRPTAVTA